MLVMLMDVDNVDVIVEDDVDIVYLSEDGGRDVDSRHSEGPGSHSGSTSLHLQPPLCGGLPENIN